MYRLLIGQTEGAEARRKIVPSLLMPWRKGRIFNLEVRQAGGRGRGLAAVKCPDITVCPTSCIHTWANPHGGDVQG